MYEKIVKEALSKMQILIPIILVIGSIWFISLEYRMRKLNKR